MFSCNGRPGTRQGVRPPHRGAVLPVDAYSLAVACGSRGVSLDIWPASHSAPAVPRAVRLSGHDRDRSPSRTTRRATTWFPPRRLSPAGAGSLPRLGGPPGRHGPPPSARYRECGVRCHAMRRPRTLLLCSKALAQLLVAAFTRRALRPGNVACGDRCVRGTLAPHHHAGTNDLLSKALGATGRKAAFAPRHYRIPPTGDRPRKAPSAASDRRPVVTGRCVSRRPASTTTVRIIVSVARITAMSGRAGSPPAGRSGRSRRPSAAPASRCPDRAPAPPRCACGPPARRGRRTRSRPPPRAAPPA